MTLDDARAQLQMDHLFHIARKHTEICARCGDRVGFAYTHNHHGLHFDLIQTHAHEKEFFCHIGEDGTCRFLRVGPWVPRHKCEGFDNDRAKAWRTVGARRLRRIKS